VKAGQGSRSDRAAVTLTRFQRHTTIETRFWENASFTKTVPRPKATFIAKPPKARHIAPMSTQTDIRYVARVLVLNDQDAVFLLRGRDDTLPDRAPFWFTPGGKIDPGETRAEAAARELYEEVGIVISPEELGNIVGTEAIQYHFHGVAYQQEGVFYAYRSNDAGLNTSAWTDIETRTIDQGRYWSLSELRATTETLYPPHLADMLAGLITQASSALTPPD
jgi:8-oxo-dGTP pyrophosphatase MutT (NUDIX family)